MHSADIRRTSVDFPGGVKEVLFINTVGAAIRPSELGELERRQKEIDGLSERLRWMLACPLELGTRSDDINDAGSSELCTKNK